MWGPMYISLKRLASRIWTFKPLMFKSPSWQVFDGQHHAYFHPSTGNTFYHYTTIVRRFYKNSKQSPWHLDIYKHVMYIQIMGCRGWVSWWALSFQLTTGPGFQQLSITEKASLRPHKISKAKTWKKWWFSLTWDYLYPHFEFFRHV